MVDKSAIAGFINNADLARFKKNIATSASRAELKAEQDKLLKLQTFDWFELFLN